MNLCLEKNYGPVGLRYRKTLIQFLVSLILFLYHLKWLIFCDSEFWHGYNWSEQKNDFKSNRTFWEQKIERNVERDNEVNERLKSEGWTVIRFWGKEIKKDVKKCADIIEIALKSNI